MTSAPLIEPDGLIIDSKSGTSGAGRSDGEPHASAARPSPAGLRAYPLTAMTQVIDTPAALFAHHDYRKFAEVHAALLKQVGRPPFGCEHSPRRANSSRGSVENPE